MVLLHRQFLGPSPAAEKTPESLWSFPAFPFLFAGAEGAGGLVGGDAPSGCSGFLVEDVELRVLRPAAALDLRRGTPGLGGLLFSPGAPAGGSACAPGRWGSGPRPAGCGAFSGAGPPPFSAGARNCTRSPCPGRSCGTGGPGGGSPRKVPGAAHADEGKDDPAPRWGDLEGTALPVPRSSWRGMAPLPWMVCSGSWDCQCIFTWMCSREMETKSVPSTPTGTRAPASSTMARRLVPHTRRMRRAGSPAMPWLSTR